MQKHLFNKTCQSVANQKQPYLDLISLTMVSHKRK